MSYNDLIIIILLSALIMTILFKNDNVKENIIYVSDENTKLKTKLDKPKYNKVKNENSKTLIAKSIYNNQHNKNMIIDKYSEFDNIKSLNSMDNTLSDLVSVIEKSN